MNSLVPVTPKLVKLIPLLGTDKSGELIAAVHAIRRTLETAGCDLHDLALVVEHAALPVVVDIEQSRWQAGPGCHWRDLARRCLSHLDELRPSERKFLRDILRWRGTPTPKQRAWLAAIAEALGLEVPA